MAFPAIRIFSETSSIAGTRGPAKSFRPET
jgi:hypothetical protein